MMGLRLLFMGELDGYVGRDGDGMGLRIKLEPVGRRKFLDVIGTGRNVACRSMPVLVGGQSLYRFASAAVVFVDAVDGSLQAIPAIRVGRVGIG